MATRVGPQISHKKQTSIEDKTLGLCIMARPRLFMIPESASISMCGVLGLPVDKRKGPSRWKLVAEFQNNHKGGNSII